MDGLVDEKEGNQNREDNLFLKTSVTSRRGEGGGGRIKTRVQKKQHVIKKEGERKGEARRMRSCSPEEGVAQRVELLLCRHQR